MTEKVVSPEVCVFNDENLDTMTFRSRFQESIRIKSICIFMNTGSM